MHVAIIDISMHARSIRNWMYPYPTDVNQDGKRDIADLAIVCFAIGTTLGDPRWQFVADVNRARAHSNETFNAKRANTLQEAVKDADCIVIATDHFFFKEMNFDEIKNQMNDRPIIIDGRRIVKPDEVEKLGFRYCGLGLGK